jgi:hypothetical protein
MWSTKRSFPREAFPLKKENNNKNNNKSVEDVVTLGQQSLRNQYLPHFESKSYQINSIKSCSSSSLSNNTKGTFRILRNFQLWLNLILGEKIIQYSRTFAPQVQTSWNQAHAPLLVMRAFQRPQEHDLKHPGFGGSHNYKTKQTTFLHR